MLRSEALAQHFTIDEGSRPIGYKGDRFAPSELVKLRTEEEEDLRFLLQQCIVTGKNFLKEPSAKNRSHLVVALQESHRFLWKKENSDLC